MLDRIDLHIDVPPVTAADLALPRPSEGTGEASARVAAARALQAERAASLGASLSLLNSGLEGEPLEAVATPDDAGRALLARAAQAMGLSARGWTRTLRLARTIADLDGATGVRRLHVAEALIYRRSQIAANVTPIRAHPEDRFPA